MLNVSAPHWKVSDPAVISVSSSAAPGARETGTIDKLQRSYGFIQCRQRDVRLFFHFSEYAGDINELSVGDDVEFQQSFDRRTGKALAVAVVKVTGPDLSSNGSIVHGHIVVEARRPKKAVSNPLIHEGVGRVCYEEGGECFYIPYLPEDVQGGRVHQGDEVTFTIVQDESGSLRATQLSVHQNQAKVEGVVCSLKDGYGFIERADAVKEIFFHYSEYNHEIADLVLGDDVEFAIVTRNGKEVAINITKLAEGSVVFEDISTDVRRGRIVSTLKQARGRRSSDPLGGRIVYETVKDSIEVPYGDKDQMGDYTLLLGDLVDFHIATDRRDGLQRATDIRLVEETFKISGEGREKGVVASIKDGYGFIRCVDREARMFYHFTEVMNVTEPKLDQEVEFTVVQDPANINRLIAIRIKILPPGSICFDTVLPDKMSGVVKKQPSTDPGIIMYDVNGTKQTITYETKDIINNKPKVNDNVEFYICESRKNNTRSATKVHLEPAACKGFIAALKETFGFIETENHQQEIFFHYTSFNGDSSTLQLGDEVEYCTGKRTTKVAADWVRPLAPGSLAQDDIVSGVLYGCCVRSLRIWNPDQDEYHGVIEGAEGLSLMYGITGLLNKKEILQKGDKVRFQIAKVKATGLEIATNIASVRNYLRAKVDSLKSDYGFLDYEAESGRKLFFHLSEVQDQCALVVGDQVEFVLLQSQRSGRFSAINVRKLPDRRPDRLVSRLKSCSDDNNRIILLRQPKGPDGTKGFHTRS